MKKQLLYIVGILIVLHVGLINTINAASFTWTGTTSSSWSVAGNWSGGGGGTPGSGDNITMNSNAPNNLVLDQNRTVTNFTINGDTLDLGTYTFTTTGVTYFNGGLVNNGNLSISGSLCHFGGATIDARIESNCGYYHMNGGVFNKPTILVSSGSASTSGTGNCTFADSLSITNNGSYYFTMSSTHGNNYNGPVIIVNNATHEVYLSTSDTSYYKNLIINNTSSGGVVLGNLGGVSYLDSGKTISIGNSGFSNNYLTLKNFYQIGYAPQTLTLTGTAILNLINANFDADLTVTSPGILLKNNTFNGITTITRNGSSGNFHCDGGNFFNSTFSLNNAGSTGRIRMANTIADLYGGSTTFNSTGGQDVQIAYSGVNQFLDDITLNSNKVVFNSGNGTVVLSGGRNQTLLGNYNYSFRKLSLSKSFSEVTTNSTISVDDTLLLNLGNLITSSTALLTMKAGSKAIQASEASFVSGPMKKIGNTEFEFPVGKENVYRPLKISAPSTSTHAFTAEYFKQGQPFGENLDTTLAYIDDCSYWNLTRNVGSSEVFVTLSWESEECPVTDTTWLKIVNWNDDKWNDLGHGSVVGNLTAGNMTSSNDISEYGNFALAYDIQIFENPRPDSYTVGSGFVANQGQLIGTDSLPKPEIYFYGNAGNSTLYLSDSVFSHVFSTSKTIYDLDSTFTYQVSDSLLRFDMKLLDSRNDFEIISNDTSQGYKNYYLGYLNTAVTHALTYQEIKYQNIYNDIDLAFYNNDEFRFLLKENADPRSIQFYYQGIDSTVIDEYGNLKLYTALGEKHYALIAYEVGSDDFEQVDINFIKSDSIISLALGTYNSSLPLMIVIINPNTGIPINPKDKIRWSTYYGGETSQGETFKDVYIDESQNIFMVGWSESAYFPTINAVQLAGGGIGAVVVKFLPNRDRVFSTYYGNTATFGMSLGVDQNQNILFTGYSSAGFLYPCPTCIGYNEPSNLSLGNINDAFVAKLNILGQISPAQAGMSSFYGSNGNDVGLSIAVDLNNNFYIAGGCGDEMPQPSSQPAGSFYQGFTSNPNSTLSFMTNGFVAMFNSSNDLIWSTHLGGDGNSAPAVAEGITSICTDIQNQLYFFGVSGSSSSGFTSPCTSNTSTNFPITGPANAYVHAESGSMDHTIGMFDEDHKLIWSTLFGGSDAEVFNLDQSHGSIDINRVDGNLFIAAATSSSSIENFPLKSNGISGSFYHTSLGGFIDGYIAKFDSDFSQLWTSYIGGSSSFDHPNSISVSDNGSFYVAGWTASTDFPTQQSGTGAFWDPYLNDGIDVYSSDGFLARFDQDCKLKYSSFIGGTLEDRFYGVSYQRLFDNPQHVIAVGTSSSNNFPCREFNPATNVTNDYFDPDNIIPVGSFVNWKCTIFNLYNVNTISRMANDNPYSQLENEDSFSCLIYPNPASTTLIISSIKNRIQTVKLFDIQGKIFLEKRFDSFSECELDISNFESGLYLIQVQGVDFVYSSKIIIQKL